VDEQIRSLAPPTDAVARSRWATANFTANTMSKGLKSLLACGLVAAAIPLAARAAPPGFCRDYATAAVRQVQLARSNPACDRGTGARWTSDYRVHFDWCLGAAPGAVEAERAARTTWIRTCRGR
jgi:hypothetical protein